MHAFMPKPSPPKTTSRCLSHLFFKIERHTLKPTYITLSHWNQSMRSLHWLAFSLKYLDQSHFMIGRQQPYERHANNLSSHVNVNFHYKLANMADINDYANIGSSASTIIQIISSISTTKNDVSRKKGWSLWILCLWFLLWCFPSCFCKTIFCMILYFAINTTHITPISTSIIAHRNHASGQCLCCHFSSSQCTWVLI